MGCDIHLYVEVRPVVEWNRPDATIQDLLRRASAGDEEAALELAAAEIRAEAWELGAAGFFKESPPESPLEDPNEAWLFEFWSSVDPERMEPRWEDDPYYQIYRRDPELGLTLFDGRHYRLFALMTGTVRNYDRLEGITEDPRGFPEDATGVSRREYLSWEGDAHSASWLSAAEVLAFEAAHPEHSETLAYLGAEAWAAAYGGEFVRYVFWFDN